MKHRKEEVLEKNYFYTKPLSRSTSISPVGLLESFQGQNQQLGVVLVRQGRERNGGKATGLEPVNCGRVDGHSLLRRNVRTVLREYNQILISNSNDRYYLKKWSLNN